MRIVKRLGLVLVAAFAFSAMAVSCASAAPKFLAHPPKALILAFADNTQVFKTKPGNVECTALKLLSPGDVAPALEASSILVIVKYENCTAFGISATVHPVHFEIFANGLARIARDVKILAATGCEVTVPSASNQSLWTVKFDNTSNNGILLLANVTKITSSGVGGLFGLCAYGSENEGTYVGTTHVKLDGPANGVIRWDP